MSNIALITGGSSGVGRSIALKLADSGWKVYIGSRSLNDGEVIDGLSCVNLDVTSEKSCKAAVDKITAQEGKLDCLVNAAGYSLSCAIEEMSADELHSELDVNLYGALRMIREVLPQMRGRKDGTIVTVGSVAGFVTIPFQGAYSISKYALEAMNEALGMECRPFNVRAIIIDPGDMKTNFTKNRVYSKQVPETSYRPYFDYAIHAMARDEQKGVSPDKCAAVTVKAITRKRHKSRIVVGFSYQMVNVLRRLLTVRFSGKIVSMVYTKPLEDDELWSFDRDILEK